MAIHRNESVLVCKRLRVLSNVKANQDKLKFSYTKSFDCAKEPMFVFCIIQFILSKCVSMSMKFSSAGLVKKAIE